METTLLSLRVRDLIWDELRGILYAFGSYDLILGLGILFGDELWGNFASMLSVLSMN